MIIRGTDRDDRLTGTTDRLDIIFGMGGDDFIFGASGRDRIHGGPGDDRLYGGNGNDELFGDAGHNILNGGAGNDRIWAGESALIWGGDGRDIVYLTGTRWAKAYEVNIHEDHFLFPDKRKVRLIDAEVVKVKGGYALDWARFTDGTTMLSMEFEMPEPGNPFSNPVFAREPDFDSPYWNSAKYASQYFGGDGSALFG